MTENILRNIIKKKEIRLTELKRKKPLESIPEHAPGSMNYINFKDAYNNSREHILSGRTFKYLQSIQGA